MPTYEYECTACKHAFERFHSMTAPPVKRCPECGKAKVKRLMGTGAGLIFKGSGFYITDYRSDSYNTAAKADGPASASGDAKSADAKSGDAKPVESKAAESKSETRPAADSPKPAAKADPKPPARPKPKK